MVRHTSVLAYIVLVLTIGVVAVGSYFMLLDGDYLLFGLGVRALIILSSALLKVIRQLATT